MGCWWRDNSSDSGNRAAEASGATTNEVRSKEEGGAGHPAPADPMDELKALAAKIEAFKAELGGLH